MSEKQTGLGKLWNNFKTRDDIICPNVNCNYKGAPKIRSKFNWLIFIVLLFLGVIPGIIYMAIATGHTLSCPQCNMAIGSK